MTAPKIRLFNGDGAPPRILPITQASPPARKGPTLRRVMERHLIPAMLAQGRKPATISDIRRALDGWEEYWLSQPARSSPAEGNRERISNPFPVLDDEGKLKKIPAPLRVRGVKRRHLEEYQLYLKTAKSRRGRPYSPSTINGELGSIRQIMTTAEKHGLLHRRPRVEKLAEHAAPKFYITRDQVDHLWDACDMATWPRIDGLLTANWWRCALCLFWTYGFRTQELISFQVGKSSLCWSAITLGGETPNPTGTAVNPYGWLAYVPQKQSWAKPDPLYLPLTPTARGAIDWLAGAARTLSGGELPPDRPLFPWSSAHKSLYGQWLAIQRRARVATKAGPPYQLKAFRKSAATYLEQHWPGLGESVIGWSKRDNGRSKVMTNHYSVDENVMVEKLATYPVPACFAAFLDAPPQQQQLMLFE